MNAPASDTMTDATIGTTEALKSALQAQLGAIAQRPVTPRNLLELEKTARLGRELLAVGKDPRSTHRRRQQYSLGTYEYDGEDGEGGEDTVLANPGMPTNKAETFGATIVREAVSAISGLLAPRAPEPTLSELIAAIALADHKKLPDVAQALREQLQARTVAMADLPPRPEDTTTPTSQSDRGYAPAGGTPGVIHVDEGRVISGIIDDDGSESTY